VPSVLPEGNEAPRDGSLPESALAGLGKRDFGFYVHVPFCTVRCGYCDFNTYTALELGNQPGSSRATYPEAAIKEIRQARDVLREHVVPVQTVFFGGGTPTLLPPQNLIDIVATIRTDFGLAADAEITTESNPDSVTRDDLEALREGGINRISFGVQSTDRAVLGVLDRTHDPARVPQVVSWAREVGFEQVSVDLIYGTPGESVGSWRHTVDRALALSPDHVSAYALIVEQGTALARRIGRGELPMPDDDDLADKYDVVDDALTAAGIDWYEVSNWSRDDGSRCRHNLGYWKSADWWGVGPGAHSHVGGVRWWNVKHPVAYASRLSEGASPAAAREILDDETRRVERVLLETRLGEGIRLDVLDDAGRASVPAVVSDGLAEIIEADRLVLTRRGRLLADAVVRALLP
jgi:putative oxygen-independent coproporphyrinogen III oxidase